jgi:tRNA(Ile)-lysidine synthase
MMPMELERTQAAWDAFHSGPHGVPVGERITVAVSGGPDSTALACAAAASRTHSLQLLHVQHRLRGEDSVADQRFVEALAASLDLPLIVEEAAIDGAHAIETRAREARLCAFRKIGGVLATAHTADDQVETIQMRLERGTGLPGLCGIPERRTLGLDGVLIRPLLALSRVEIELDLQEAGQGWCEDAMNADPAWHRNRTRHRTLPGLNSLAPGWSDDLLRMRELAVDICSAVDDWVARHLDPCEGTFSRTVPAEMIPYLVAEAFRRQEGATPDLTESQLKDCVASILDGQSVHGRLPGGRWIRVVGDRVAVGQGAGSAQMPAVRWEVTEWSPTDLSGCTPESIWINPAAVQGTIRVRRRQSGDRFRPFGSAGRRKLKEFLIDSKVPQDQRDAVPIVVDDAGILWVGGLRPDERTRMGPDATQGIRMWIESEKSDVMSSV